jgi:hypothetical protein
MKYKDENDEGRRAADSAAQYLANLVGRPVAGKTPEPLIDDPESEKILSQLLRGEIEPGGFSTNTEDPYFGINAPFIVLSGLVNGSPKLRQHIIKEMDSVESSNPYISALYEEIKQAIHDNDIDKEKLKQIEVRIPDIWRLSKNEPLKGHLKLGVYHRWFQITKNVCDDELILKAINLIKESAK